MLPVLLCEVNDGCLEDVHLDAVELLFPQMLRDFKKPNELRLKLQLLVVLVLLLMHHTSGSAHSEFTSGLIEQADCIAYLNVHVGISIGTMASLDVGTSDRWEYLIVGQPVSEVATAESEANKGGGRHAARSQLAAWRHKGVSCQQQQQLFSWDVQVRLRGDSIGLLQSLSSER